MIARIHRRCVDGPGTRNEEADIEHDDPEHAPTYRGETLVCVAGVVLTTPERARELLEDVA